MALNENVPDSFCTVATNSVISDIICFVLSLSIHHPNSKLYLLCDSKVKNELDRLTPKPKLDLIILNELDKYSGIDRKTMEKKGIFLEFLMNKIKIMNKALEKSHDTLFLDSDMLIINKINTIDKTKDLGVSPQFIRDKNAKEVGYYNAGMLWTKNKNLPNDWRSFSYKSHYFEQTSITDLAHKYSHFTFGPEYNLQTWRFILGKQPQNELIKSITVKNNTILLNNKPLRNLHTHFNNKDPQMMKINRFFLSLLIKAKYYRELLIINRSLKGFWSINIPKQPRNDIFNHNNDSFRELAVLMANNNKDLKINITPNTNCNIDNKVILYDRPTLKWFDIECKKAFCLLLGNGSIHHEGKEIQKNNLKVLPWIFWARRPSILENFIKKPLLKFNERPIESIFIGNFENNVQEKYRKNNNWKSVLAEYHCTAGHKHKFTQEQYLTKLSQSRFGLTLRGFGSKCHREVELMAVGCVPIITPEVSIKSYINPPQENIHYLTASTPQELKQKISNITEEKWNEMSNACHQWYLQNCHSLYSWNTTINTILYH